MYIFNKSGALLMLGMIFILSGASATADDTFRYKFNEGDCIVYKMINSQCNEQMGMKIESEQVQFIEYKVKDVEDDVATCELTIKRITFKGNNPMQGEVSYDSAAEGEPVDPNMKMYELMLDKPFTLKMNNLGKILSISGYSEIAKAMIASVVGESTDPQAQMQAKMMESMFSDDAMAKMMSQSNTCFPKQAISKGDKWDEKSAIEIPSLGDLVSEMKNTYEGMEGDLAKFKIEGSISMKPVEEGEAADPQDPMAAMRKMMKITDGKMTGTLEFDHDKGIIKKKVQDMTLNISLMGQLMPMKQTQSLVLDSYKAAD